MHVVGDVITLFSNISSQLSVSAWYLIYILCRRHNYITLFTNISPYISTWPRLNPAPNICYTLLACNVLYHFNRLFSHRSQQPSKRRLGQFFTGHNGNWRDGHKFSVPAVLHLLLTINSPENLSEEMFRMSHLISGTKERLISSWQSQVTRGEE